MSDAASLMDQVRFERVLAWEKAKTAADIAAESEKRLRCSIIELDFADRVEGTNTIRLPDGRELKCVAAFEYATDADRAKSCIEKLRKIGNEGTFLADRLFTFKPSVAAGELKKLAPQYRKVVDKLVDVKPKSPSLKIHEPAA